MEHELRKVGTSGGVIVRDATPEARFGTTSSYPMSKKI
jgi:hypothetical protein